MRTKLIVLLCMIVVAIGCQEKHVMPAQEQQPTLISLEMKFTNIFVHDKSVRAFKTLWHTEHFVKKIAGSDSLAAIDSLLVQYMERQKSIQRNYWVV